MAPGGAPGLSDGTPVLDDLGGGGGGGEAFGVGVGEGGGAEQDGECRYGREPQPSFALSDGVASGLRAVQACVMRSAVQFSTVQNPHRTAKATAIRIHASTRGVYHHSGRKVKPR